MPAPVSKPTPRFSLRWKITLPFILLALLLSLGMVYLLSRIVGQEQQERYLRQMTDSGQQAADAVVRIEDELLATERLIANTEGILDGVQQADSEGAASPGAAAGGQCRCGCGVDRRRAGLQPALRAAASGRLGGRVHDAARRGVLQQLALCAAAAGRHGGRRHRGQADGDARHSH